MTAPTRHILAWTRFNAGIQLSALAVAWWRQDLHIWVWLSMVPFVILPVFALREKERVRLLTWPNGISVLRLVATWAAIYIWIDQPFITALWALGILTLDWVDGWVARKTGQITPWGGILDKEADALLVGFLCLMLWWEKDFTAALLGLAALRYVYVVTRMLLPAHRGVSEPRFRHGVLIAGWFIASLLIALGVPAPFDGVVLALGAVAILYSFVRSFYYLLLAEETM